jgi:hypothetical protein
MHTGELSDRASLIGPNLATLERDRRVERRTGLVIDNRQYSTRSSPTSQIGEDLEFQNIRQANWILNGPGIQKLLNPGGQGL